MTSDRWRGGVNVPAHARVPGRGVRRRGRRDAQVHHVLDLLAPVSNAQLAFLQLLCHLLLPIWVLRRKVLHVFHQTLNIAQTEKLRDEGLWRESVQVGEMLASAQEDDGRASGCDTETESLLCTYPTL